MSGPPPLSARGVSVRAGDHRILEGISFDLREGELLTLVGPSGAGKSTLLRVLNRLADLEDGLRVSGHVLCRGREIFNGWPPEELRTRVGMMFQKPCVYPGSVARNVLFGVRHHRRLRPDEAQDLIESVLRRAHLWEEVKHRLHRAAAQLSVGQQQRLCFARALAVEPEILLLDEPTSSLDAGSTARVEETLLELRANARVSILLVTHQADQARRLSDRVLEISAASGVGRLTAPPA